MRPVKLQRVLQANLNQSNCQLQTFSLRHLRNGRLCQETRSRCRVTVAGRRPRGQGTGPTRGHGDVKRNVSAAALTSIAACDSDGAVSAGDAGAGLSSPAEPGYGALSTAFN